MGTYRHEHEEAWMVRKKENESVKRKKKDEMVDGNICERQLLSMKEFLFVCETQHTTWILQEMGVVLNIILWVFLL